MRRRLHHRSHARAGGVAAVSVALQHQAGGACRRWSNWHGYTGLEENIKSSQELRPTPAGRLRNAVRAQDTATLWGHSGDAHPLVAPLAAAPAAVRALRLWQQMGNDPLHLSTYAFTPEARPTEDAIGSDLSSPDPEFRRQSEAAWRHYLTLHYTRAVRLSRTTGASQVGLLKDSTPAEDECDKPSTTWAQDRELIRALSVIGDALPDQPSNLEQLHSAVLGCTPEQFHALVEAGYPAESPFQYAPVPTSARWHLTGDALAEWALDFQGARAEAEATHAAIRKALDGAQWRDVARALSAKVAEVGAVRLARFQRQLAAAENDVAAMAKRLAAQEAAAFLGNDFDPADAADSSEQWLAEHERITAAADAPLLDGVDGLTLRSVWSATTRLEALEFKHLYTAERHRETHAACLERVLREDGYEALVRADSAVAATSQYCSANGDLALGTVEGATPAVWCKAHWWRFCGSGVVTQHAATGTRQLERNAAPLGSVPAIAKLHYALRPLSSAIDCSTPHNHRRSVVDALVEFGLADARARGLNDRTVRQLLLDTEEAVSAATQAAAWPVGVARRAAAKQQRERLAKGHTHPITDVSVVPPTVAQLQAREGLGVTNEKAWILGSSRQISYRWEPATAVTLPTNSNPVIETLERQQLARRVGMEVSLWAKTGATECDFGAMSREKHAIATALCKESSEYASLAASVAFATKRIAEANGDAGAAALPSDGLPATFVPEPLEGGYDFVAVLDDNHPGSVDGKLNVHISHVNAGFGGAPGRPTPPGTYRLRLRAFQHDENPDHDPVLCAEAFTEDFEVVDALGNALVKHGAIGLENQNGGVLPAANFMPFFEELRAAGFAVTTALEFEAGQALDGNGDAIVAHIQKLIGEARYADVGARRGISAAMLDIEPRVAQHFAVAHPGASMEEWFTRRRFVLERAISRERDWWLPDDQLDVTSPLDIKELATAEMRERYVSDFLHVLEAHGRAGTRRADGAPRPVALVEAAYAGSGVVSSLKLSEECESLSVDDVLKHCVSAIDQAHTRFNTTANSRVAPLERTLRHYLLANRHVGDFSGKYAATYVDAYRRAAAAVDGRPSGSTPAVAAQVPSAPAAAAASPASPQPSATPKAAAPSDATPTPPKPAATPQATPATEDAAAKPASATPAAEDAAKPTDSTDA